MSIPTQMDAVQLAQEGGLLTLQHLPVPRPAAGEVLIRVAAAPINPSDLGFLAGTYTQGRALPVVPGFEGSGTVVAAGAGLFPRLLAGRRVAFAVREGGSWAEYAVARAQACVPIGRRIDLESAATSIVNPLTALAFFEIARSGGHAAIVSNAAASALGRMVIRLGRARGVPIVNVVHRAEQADELRGQGAEHVLVSTATDHAKQLRDLAHRLRATLVLDAIGGEQSQLLVDATPVGSTILAYSMLSGAPSVFSARTLISDRKRIEGFYLAHWLEARGLWRTMRDVRRVQRLLSSDLRTRVQARFMLADAQQALQTYRDHMSAGKVLLVPRASVH
ncbi:MAG TPA: zinc-binding dehydrogenase [Vicinamibacteria bacterium]|nr:zinc-binding dehydrogenase [Vicinamibacteria bacterium]